MDYISNSDADKAEMLRMIGARSFADLISNIPSSLKKLELKLPAGISELELDRHMDEIGHANKNFKYSVSYLGAGNYDHFFPAVVDRLALRGEFITAYTPYQGEASQGTLQSMYEYQSLICEITAMDVSNASMYDGASSLAEAALLALRLGERKKILMPATIHPEYREVVKTYLSSLDAEIVDIPMKNCVADLTALERAADAESAAILVQQPNFFGALEETHRIGGIAKKAGALFVACVNPASLGVLAPPGEYDADIAVGEGQPLGNPVSYGGPHFGFFTVKNALLRKIPGRISGMTVDKIGRRAFVLTLQAREQHIRREKATSNICTNQALCALKGAIYLSLLGKEGLKKLGLLNVAKARKTHDRLLKIKGVQALSTAPFFNEFALRIDKDPGKLKENLKKRNILGPLALENFYPEMRSAYLFAVTEKRTDRDLETLAAAIEETH